MRTLRALIAIALLVSGCAAPYTLVRPAPVLVADGRMKVRPLSAWNRTPQSRFDLAGHESWTRNGPLLDTVTFIGGVDPGTAIAKQRYNDPRKVPAFWDDMSPQDLVSMIESYYRIKMGVTLFETANVQPVTFLGQQGIRFDYNYVSTDEVRRLGRCVMAIVEGKLYLMILDAAALHYFDAALAEFEAMIVSASKL